MVLHCALRASIDSPFRPFVLNIFGESSLFKRNPCKVGSSQETGLLSGDSHSRGGQRLEENSLFISFAMTNNQRKKRRKTSRSFASNIDRAGPTETILPRWRPQRPGQRTSGPAAASESDRQLHCPPRRRPPKPAARSDRVCTDSEG